MDASLQLGYAGLSTVWPKFHSPHKYSEVKEVGGGFSTREQTKPAPLFLIRLVAGNIKRRLLLFAGIEPNPGPVEHCAICSNKFGKLACICCHLGGWIHLKCSKLKKTKQWDRNFTCGACHYFNNTAKAPATKQLFNTNQIFKVLQININGQRGKLDNVVNYMLEKHIQVAAIQETHLTSKCNIKAPPGFQLIAMTRPEKRGKGGGVAFLVSDEIKYSVKTLKNDDDHAEVQAIVIPYKDQQLTLINTYIPPSSSCSPGYSATLSNLLSGTATIIVGDMNAHNSLWFSSLSADSRGDKFAEEIDNSTFVVINENTPTRKTASCSSSPDISIVSSDLAMSTSWSCESRLGSDHLPIIISLACEVHEVEAGKKSYINFKKTDWENFTKSLKMKSAFVLHQEMFTKAKNIQENSMQSS